MLTNFLKTYLIHFLLLIVFSMSVTIIVFYFQKSSLIETIELQERNITSTHSLLLLCKENSKVEAVEAEFKNKEPKETKYDPKIENNSTDYSIQFFSM